jgi:hypothetical protein
MLDTANPSDLLLIQIMAGLRHRYESLSRHYEEQLINDFRLNAPTKSFEREPAPARLTLSKFAFRRWLLLLGTFLPAQPAGHTAITIS